MRALGFLVASVLASVLAAALSTPPPPVRWYKEAAAGNAAGRYTLGHTPDANPELAAFVNGLYETEGFDYTVSGRVVTFAGPLSKDDAVRFWYLGK